MNRDFNISLFRAAYHPTIKLSITAAILSAVMFFALKSYIAYLLGLTRRLYRFALPTALDLFRSVLFRILNLCAIISHPVTIADNINAVTLLIVIA